MKEICIDVRMALHSGIGTYIRNIVSKLKEAPFKLRLITDRGLVQKWPLLTQFDLILTSAPLYSIEEQIKFPFLVPACDLFWSPHYNVPLIPVRAKKRLTTIHDVYHLAFGRTLSMPKRLYAKVVIQGAVKLSDHILTDSHFSKDEIIKYTKISNEKISVIHLGVDSSHFSLQIDEATLMRVREKYRLPQNYFLFVSTLAPHKNIERLLRAWNIVARRFPDWKLVLIGRRVKTAPWQSFLDETPSLQNHLLFLGHIEEGDLPALYRLAFGAVHPSLYEGFGLTPLEAMSSGCPTVVSKIASLPEACGDCTVYVDPYDVQDIAAGMCKIIDDPTLRQELREKGFKRCHDFTWDKTVQTHIKILESLV